MLPWTLESIIEQASPETIESLSDNYFGSIPKVLDLVANHGDILAKSRVASNRRTMLSTLEKLSRLNYRLVLSDLAHNPNSNESILLRLAGTGDDEITSGIARHPNVTVEVVQRLAKSKKYSVRHHAAASIYVAAVPKLAKDESAYVRAAVAHNPAAPSNLLQQLATDEDEEVLLGLITNSNARIDKSKMLLSMPNAPAVYERLARNPDCPAELLELIYRSASKEALENIAMNPKTPIRILKVLVGTKALAALCASNEALPEELKSALFKSGTVAVRHALAENVGTSLQMLEELSNDKSIALRQKVAENASASSATLSKLATDQRFEVRLNVARNRNTSPRDLELLCVDRHLQVKEIARKRAPSKIEWMRKAFATILKEHPKTDFALVVALSMYSDEPLLLKASKHKLPVVRAAVLFSPACSADLASIVSKDANAKVRATAKCWTALGEVGAGAAS